MSADDPEVLTVSQTAALLAVDRHTVYALIRAGVVPIVKLTPRTWRVPRWLLIQRLEQIAEHGNGSE